MSNSLDSTDGQDELKNLRKKYDIIRGFYNHNEIVRGVHTRLVSPVPGSDNEAIKGAPARIIDKEGIERGHTNFSELDANYGRPVQTEYSDAEADSNRNDVRRSTEAEDLGEWNYEDDSLKVIPLSKK